MQTIIRSEKPTMPPTISIKQPSKPFETVFSPLPDDLDHCEMFSSFYCDSVSVKYFLLSGGNEGYRVGRIFPTDINYQIPRNVCTLAKKFFR